MTRRQAITIATERLAADPHLQATAARDAEYLLLHLLQLGRATLLAHPADVLTAEQQSLYDRTIARRLTHEPIQYITGQQEFYGLNLRVTPATLIPRPETEHLVEAVLQRLPKDKPHSILDIGTGSGAIALALAAHLPQATITAVDISCAALAVAAANARAHGLIARMHFAVSDLLSDLPNQTFDCIVSNPPYIPAPDRASLHPQVRDFEPAQALFAGELGLDLYRRLIPAARLALVPGGLLALEIGYGQRQPLADLLIGWQDVSFHNDLQGIPRVVLATRPSSLVSLEILRMHRNLPEGWPHARSFWVSPVTYFPDR